jgi:AraC-like DNA-binding protein
MPRWKVTFDTQRRVHRHRTPRGFGHSLVTPVATAVFRTLRVWASLTDGNYWWPLYWPLHAEPNVANFEDEHRLQGDRGAYNRRIFTKARRTRSIVVSERAGYFDLVVPVVAGGEVEAMIVTGPIARSRPTAEQILERWRRVTGRQGHPADPEFAAYLSASLHTLVLDDGVLTKLQRLLSCMAKIMGGEGPADALANEVELLHLELWETRHIERTWESAQSMVDDRFPRLWHGVSHSDPLRILGLSRPPDHVLVGLTVSRTEDLDPVGDAVRRDAFQRATVDLARRLGGIIAGRVGDHGVMFLAAPSGSPQQKLRRLRDLSEHASALAERSFRLSLHCGAGVASDSRPLSRTYLAALAAAESALTEGTRLVMAEPKATRPLQSLRHLRRALAAEMESRPDELRARFDRYLEGVALQSGYNVDLARAHLDVGFERMAEVLVGSGGLDEKSFRSMWEALDRAAAGAPTMTELLASYRRAVADVSEAVRHPLVAKQGRNLRGALELIHQHYSEPIGLRKVAAAAGFAPNYFSKLFLESQGVRFGDYLRSIRLERARQLLAETTLDVTRVSALSGFRSVQYFCRAFQKRMGMSPLAYRKNPARRVRSKVQKEYVQRSKTLRIAPR